MPTVTKLRKSDDSADLQTLHISGRNEIFLVKGTGFVNGSVAAASGARAEGDALYCAIFQLVTQFVNGETLRVTVRSLDSPGGQFYLLKTPFDPEDRNEEINPKDILTDGDGTITILISNPGGTRSSLYNQPITYAP